MVKHKFMFPKYSATPVETYGVIAHYQSSSDSLTIWSNFHGPFTLQSVMAAALRINSNQLRIMIPKDVGEATESSRGYIPTWC